MTSEPLMVSRQICLSDGRIMPYTEHGEPSSEPNLTSYGTQGARLHPHHGNSIAISLGTRTSGVDRPGFGLSDSRPGRRSADRPEDNVVLADALNHWHFAVAGVLDGDRIMPPATPVSSWFLSESSGATVKFDARGRERAAFVKGRGRVSLSEIEARLVVSHD